jgi:hypothetical protein
LLGGENFLIFGLTAICLALWKVRNKTCFEKKTIKNPSDVFYSVCFFLNYWAGLHSGSAQHVIKEEVESMMQIAGKIFMKSPGNGVPMMLTNGDTGGDSSHVMGSQNPGGYVHWLASSWCLMKCNVCSKV